MGSLVGDPFTGFLWLRNHKAPQADGADRRDRGNHPIGVMLGGGSGDEMPQARAVARRGGGSHVNPEFLSRLQFALTASFHFIFPPISMGLGILLVWMAWKHVRTGDPVWRQSSVFWVKVYGLVFALGIATGLVQEFAFGMNWSQYSRFVGNVFGSLLAAEEVRHQRLHAGARQERRVIPLGRNERAGRVALVPLRLEEGEKTLAELGRRAHRE